VNGHRNLAVWKLAGRLIDVVYVITAALPPDERHVARPNLRRAAWSVQNNIAEGNAKLGRRELRRYLDVALGSLAEIDSVVAKLAEMYPLDPAMVAELERLRREITAGLFAMLRGGRR
jgi:four helix bundle protein